MYVLYHVHYITFVSKCTHLKDPKSYFSLNKLDFNYYYYNTRMRISNRFLYFIKYLV